MEDLQKRCFLSKIQLIDRVSYAISGYDEYGISRAGTVSGVRYEVYDMGEYGYQEYLIVEYYGGAIAVRSCNMNSNAAVIRELGRLLNGGYYDEIEDYEECRKKYTQLFVDKD